MQKNYLKNRFLNKQKQINMKTENIPEHRNNKTNIYTFNICTISSVNVTQIKALSLI